MFPVGFRRLSELSLPTPCSHHTFLFLFHGGSRRGARFHGGFTRTCAGTPWTRNHEVRGSRRVQVHPDGFRRPYKLSPQTPWTNNTFLFLTAMYPGVVSTFTVNGYVSTQGPLGPYGTKYGCLSESGGPPSGFTVLLNFNLQLCGLTTPSYFCTAPYPGGISVFTEDRCVRVPRPLGPVGIKCGCLVGPLYPTSSFIVLQKFPLHLREHTTPSFFFPFRLQEGCTLYRGLTSTRPGSHRTRRDQTSESRRARVHPVGFRSTSELSPPVL